ncbi:MAG: histidine kinase dimerization/phospho-acceptor domain-containing protein, partial [Elusimicrobiota bacterium]
MEEEINIDVVVELLKPSVGIEAAEKFIYDAIKDISLQRKKFYPEDEFKKICESLKKKGGYIATFATILQEPAYRVKYYKTLVDKERQEKEKLLSWYKELQYTYEELEKAKDKIANTERLATIGKLASVISHELRNPLAVMKTVVYLLKKKVAGDEQCENFLRILNDEIESSNRIISDLLDFAKAKKVTKIPVKIVPLIEEILSSLLCKVIDEQKINIVKNYNFDGEIAIDQQKIKHMLQNLIINAAQSIIDTGTVTI